MRTKQFFISILLFLTIGQLNASVAEARSDLFAGRFNEASNALAGLARSSEVEILEALVEVGLWFESDLSNFTKSIGANESAADSYFDASENISGSSDPIESLFVLESVNDPRGGNAYSLPLFESSTDTDVFAAFLLAEGSSVQSLLDTLLSHLDAFQPDGRVVFVPVETGMMDRLVIEYADAQVLMGFIKSFKALTMIVDMYENASIPLSSERFMRYVEEPLLILEDYPDLLSVASNRDSNGTQARALFIEAIEHYRSVEQTLWSRGSGVTDSYLFEIGLASPSNPEGLSEDDRESYSDGLESFEQSLTGFTEPLSLQSSVSTSARFSLTPFFDTSPVDLRSILPTVDESGVDPDSLSSLLEAGFVDEMSLDTLQQIFTNIGIRFSSGSTWEPESWVYFSWPYGYSISEGRWYYFNTSDTQNRVNLSDGQWGLFSGASGWHYYTWPYSYSIEQSAWHWYNDDIQWVVDLVTGTWLQFGGSR